ncbi:HD domain-containing protein [Patulibacter americanus]|uniref:HD domain-containing protein n=1 Tax=Patulibacter americanus TaxID=588672 RepID=UPI0003B761A7|nr:HD domain-containing protein [Patulibacter americanus]
MRLNDFSPPDTQAARAALQLATAYHSPALLHHVIRSWLWAEAFARIQGREDVDHELLYTAALLHDIGITTAFDNAVLAYEEAGGHVAVALTTGAGWTPERRRRVLDVIVRHNWPSVDPEVDVEGHLLEIATGLDISGDRPDALPRPFLREVLEAYPRLGLAEEFTASVEDQAARKPTTAAHRLVRCGLATHLADHPFDRD